LVRVKKNGHFIQQINSKRHPPAHRVQQQIPSKQVSQIQQIKTKSIPPTHRVQQNKYSKSDQETIPTVSVNKSTKTIKKETHPPAQGVHNHKHSKINQIKSPPNPPQPTTGP